MQEWISEIGMQERRWDLKGMHAFERQIGLRMPRPFIIHRLPLIQQNVIERGSHRNKPLNKLN